MESLFKRDFFCCGKESRISFALEDFAENQEAVGGGYLTNEEFDQYVRPENMISPG